ncbi:MAG: hypothetical protein WBB82_02440 [Limnothrix sp.]
MSASDSSATQQLNDVLPEVQQQTMPDVEFQLADFANREDFFDVIQQAFGGNHDAAALETIRRQWQSGNFTLPPIEILSSAQLQCVNGASAAETNTLYFFSDFLARDSNEMGAIAYFLVPWHE